MRLGPEKITTMNATHNFFNRRRAGILLHPTSLPGTPGNGDLGEHAYRFIDFLADSGLTVWQMLPLGPPHGDLSPYQCQSAHAANPLLISLDRLVGQGWLKDDSSPPGSNLKEAEAIAYRLARLEEARLGFALNASNAERDAYADFIATHTSWLENYALFRALKVAHQEAAWWEWPPAYRDRVPKALEEARARFATTLEQTRFEQFVFFNQWQDLRHYAHVLGVYLFGDIPIFVAEDSAEVWAERQNFLLDNKGRPTVVAGVPPDYFSATGQRWGNPHYNWERMQANGFQWWIERIKTAQKLFDLVRIDHFRGFEAYWQIPAACPTAMEGKWVKAPGEALFEVLQRNTSLPLVAEDLGIITEEVNRLRNKFGFPGMKILQFAFDSNADNPYLPHNHTSNSVVYTGTHDNNTTLGWFQELAVPVQQYVCEYLHARPYDMPWPLIESAFASCSMLAIVPMQDVLSGDASQRMNTPGTTNNRNWRWRLQWEQLPAGVNDKLRHLTKFYGRI